MFTLVKKNKEIMIEIKYSEKVGGKVMLELSGEGDFSHHLIEGCFEMLDKLARMEKVGHQSEEWTEK